MNASLRSARVLMVGAGGLGCPAAIILAKSGVGRIDIADDDNVDVSNVQRQTLFGLDDASKPKAALASERLIALAEREGHALQSAAFETRVLPDNAVAMIAGYDLVIEGADNFASKFLVADACRIAGVSVVQAGAVRWSGWALGVDHAEGPCLRCVFEDVPRGTQDTCAAAGVVGPVVGAVAALQAAIAVRMLLKDTRAAGQLVRYTALDGRIRQSAIARQAHCPLCAGQITDTRIERYVPADCAA